MEFDVVEGKEERERKKGKLRPKNFTIRCDVNKGGEDIMFMKKRQFKIYWQFWEVGVCFIFFANEILTRDDGRGKMSPTVFE